MKTIILAVLLLTISCEGYEEIQTIQTQIDTDYGELETPEKTSQQNCLEDCTNEQHDSCNSCDLYTCTGERVDCRMNCGDSCTIDVLETLFWCVTDAYSITQQKTCFTSFCKESSNCESLDRMTYAYVKYYCE